MKKAELIDNKVWLIFSYDSAIIAKIKMLPGRKYHPTRRVWSIPLILESILQLRDWEFTLNKELSQWYIKKFNNKLKGTPKIDLSQSVLPYYPFQRKGVAHIESRGGRALIGDDMGLGKTLQALGWCEYHPELTPVLVVSPATVKLKWRREAIKWFGVIDHQVLSGRTIYFVKNKILFINYDILHYWLPYLKTLNIKIIILDECHYIKGNKTKRTRAVRSLCRKIPHVIGLSGTPIVNKPFEFYNILKIIDPTLFPDYWYFIKRYCGAKFNGFGWDVTGATNTAELYDKLTINGPMIRRLKKDVLPDLPEKTRVVIPIEINMTKYNYAVEEFNDWQKENKNTAIALQKIEKLKQVAVSEKLDSVISWVDDFLESDEKIILFVTHHFVIDKLYAHFKNKIKTVIIDGRTSMKDRELAEQAFQNDSKTKLLIGNIQAAGVGIDLYAASNVAFVELGWTPGEMIQAEDRVLRIGQTADKVTAWYLIAEDTVEEDIVKILDRKTKILSQVLDGKTVKESEDDDNLLTELLNKFKEG